MSAAQDQAGRVARMLRETRQRIRLRLEDCPKAPEGHAVVAARDLLTGDATMFRCVACGREWPADEVPSCPV